MTSDTGNRPDSPHEETEQPTNEKEKDNQSSSSGAENEEYIPQITPLHQLLEDADNEEKALEGFDNALERTRGNINAHQSPFGETALHLACQFGYAKIAKKLLEADARVDIANDSGDYPLHIASRMGRAGLIDDLLGNKDEFLNTQTGYSQFTPLNRATYNGETETVDVLLRHNPNIDLADIDGWTPLMTAVKEEYTDILERLCEHICQDQDESKKDSHFNICDNEGLTPLVAAIKQDSQKSVEILLRNGAKINFKPKFGRTALHYAATCRNPRVMPLILKRMESEELCIQDDEGMTALHCAAKYSSSEAISLILEKMKADSLWTQDTHQKTALHLAAEYNDDEAILRILGKVKDQGVLIHDEDPMTALNIVCYRQPTLNGRDRVLRAIIQHLKKVPDDEGQRQWETCNPIELAASTRRPDLLWPVIETSPQTPETRKAIEDSLDIVKELIKKDTDKALSKDEEEPRDSKLRRYLRAEKRNRSYHKQWGNEFQAQSNSQDKLRDVKDVLDHFAISQNYRRNELLQPPEHSDQVNEILSNANGAVIRFYKNNNNSKIIRLGRIRSVQDIIYSDGPEKIITKATAIVKKYDTLKKGSSRSTTADFNRDKTLFTWIHLPSTNIQWMEDLVKRIMNDDIKKQSQFQGVYQFLRDSWVEVPDRTSASRFMRPRYVERRRQGTAAPKQNSKKTKDTKRSESVEAPQIFTFEEDFGRSMDLTRSRSFEVTQNRVASEEDPKRTRNADGDFIAASAVYMPYLSHSLHHKEQINNLNETDGERIKQMKKAARGFEAYLDAYKSEGAVIHGPPTLDEAYYHFLTDLDSSDNKSYRNGNQVLTKYIKKATSRKDMPCWPLIRVNQVWIWVIDNKWIITSTSQRIDDIRENLATDVLDYLSKQTEKSENQSQPACPLDLSKLIVDYCIGSYERRNNYFSPLQMQQLKEAQKQKQGDKSTNSDTRSNQDIEQSLTLSIRQIFSHYINATGLKETELFKNFNSRQEKLKKSKSKQSQKSFIHWIAQIWNHHHPEHNVNSRECISNVTELFLNVKDIRDELNILKTIAEFQLTVQKALEEPSNTETLASQYVVKDLSQMDGVAKRIQEGANTTLNLEESEVANHQARTAIKQGRTMMIFTVVTIVFLPLSFLSSLFALDVASFQEAPAWALVVIFLVSLAFSLPTAGYALASEGVNDAFQQAWKKIQGRRGERQNTVKGESIWFRTGSGDVESQRGPSCGQ